MKKIRTINGIVKELHKIDPNSAITVYYIRRLCAEKAIPFNKSGNKYLIAMEDVMEYFNKVSA